MVRKIMALLMAVVLIMALSVAVSATENGQAWLVVEPDEGTTVSLKVDTAVTDGVITVTYDAAALTYGGITVAEGQVANYAVNAQTPGTLRIGWVGPGAEVSADGAVLITLEFTGTEQTNSVTLTGTVHSADGADLALGQTQVLEKPVPPTTAPTEAEPTVPGETQKPTEGDDSPSVETGDRSMVPAAVMVALLALTGTALMVKRGWQR